MKIETQPLENHQVRLTVEFEAETVEGAKHQAARKLAQKVRIPGFRPGKAPLAVVRRMIGEESLLDEAIEIVLEENYEKMLEQAEVKAYALGKLEKLVSKDPVTLQFVIPLEPEVNLGDYTLLRRPYEPKAVTPEDVEEALKRLQEEHAVVEPVERPAQEGDVVFVRLHIDRRQVEEGQETSIVKEQPFSVMVQAENADSVEEAHDEWPFPGFSRQVIGMAAGEEKTFAYTYPQEAEEKLRGVEADVYVKVENVKSRTLPELSDTFASEVGEFETLEALRAEILSGLEYQTRQDYIENYNNALLEELLAQSTVRFPPDMVEREVSDSVRRLESRLEQQGMDLDLYYRIRGTTAEELRAELQPVAETRLKKQLALLELARVENINIPPEELQQHTYQTLNTVAQNMSEKERKQLNDQRVIRNMMGSIMADLLIERSMQRLRSIASEGASDEAASETPEETEAADTVVEQASEVQTPAVEGAPTGDPATEPEPKTE